MLTEGMIHLPILPASAPPRAASCALINASRATFRAPLVTAASFFFVAQPWGWSSPKMREMHGNAEFMSEHVNLQVKFMNEKLEFLVGFTSENGDECGKNWDLST